MISRHIITNALCSAPQSSLQEPCVHIEQIERHRYKYESNINTCTRSTLCAHSVHPIMLAGSGHRCDQVSQRSQIFRIP